MLATRLQVQHTLPAPSSNKEGATNSRNPAMVRAAIRIGRRAEMMLPLVKSKT